MPARFRKAMEDTDGGFSLIELLVVMIIIGLLAAIAVPVFLSQRRKAQDAAAKGDVTKLGQEIATYWVDGTTVPVVTQILNHYQVNGVDAGASTDHVALVTQNIVNATHWCVDVINDQGDKQTYKYSAKAGLTQGTCVAADVS